MTIQKECLFRHERAGVEFGRHQFSSYGSTTVPAEVFMQIINGGFSHEAYRRHKSAENHDGFVVGSCRTDRSEHRGNEGNPTALTRISPSWRQELQEPKHHLRLIEWNAPSAQTAPFASATFDEHEITFDDLASPSHQSPDPLPCLPIHPMNHDQISTNPR